jgi:twitching motility protein PilT
MITEEDRRFADVAMRAGLIASDQAKRVFARLGTMEGVSFAELAVLMRLLTVESVEEAARLLKREAREQAALARPALRPLDVPAPAAAPAAAPAPAPPPRTPARAPAAPPAAEPPADRGGASSARFGDRIVLRPLEPEPDERPRTDRRARDRLLDEPASGAREHTGRRFADLPPASRRAPERHLDEPPSTTRRFGGERAPDAAPAGAPRGAHAPRPAPAAPPPAEPRPVEPPAAEPPAPGPAAPPAPAKKVSSKKSRTRRIDLTEGGFEGYDIRPHLRAAREAGASDVHLSVGRRPFMRVHGRLEELDAPPAEAKDCEHVAFSLAGPERAEDLRRDQQVEFLLKDEDGRRYRCCILKQRLGWDTAIRLVRETIPTVEELGVPRQLLRLTEYPQGLVLIAGSGGSGKSSTLAAMLEAINKTREGHIITIEDPVEYVLEPDKCHVTQRELHRHTESYAKALRAALRENPDVIAIGELRDRETAAIAISAAETGHLVFATLDTGNAARTVASIVDLFPPAQRQQLLTMLSESIRGIVCQQLVPGASGKSRHLALEVLLFTPAVGALVREDKTALLATQMQTGRRLGMCRFDDSLEDLVRAKKITLEEAQARAEVKERFRTGGR